jgi:hypothetical protein
MRRVSPNFFSRVQLAQFPIKPVSVDGKSAGNVVNESRPTS